jgi:hypothetical protein
VPSTCSACPQPIHRPSLELVQMWGETRCDWSAPAVMGTAGDRDRARCARPRVRLHVKRQGPVLPTPWARRDDLTTRAPRVPQKLPEGAQGGPEVVIRSALGGRTSRKTNFQRWRPTPPATPWQLQGGAGRNVATSGWPWAPPAGPCLPLTRSRPVPVPGLSSRRPIARPACQATGLWLPPLRFGPRDHASSHLTTSARRAFASARCARRG